MAAGAAGLTYADLVVRLGVADAAELELIEGIGELALGGREVWGSRAGKRGMSQGGHSPNSSMQADTRSQPGNTHRETHLREPWQQGNLRAPPFCAHPRDRALGGPCSTPKIPNRR